MLCPNATKQRNSCEWTSSTSPALLPFSRHHTFTVFGNNSLGNNTDTFTIDIFSVGKCKFAFSYLIFFSEF